MLNLMKEEHTMSFKLKKLVLLALTCVFLVGVVSSTAFAGEDLWRKVQRKGVLRVGGAAATPYQMRNPKTGEWEGVYIDILRMFAEEMEMEIEVIDTSWDNLVSGLITGKWDIAPALNRTVKRSLVVNYSIAPHSYEISFVFKKDNSKIHHGWMSVEDFDQRNITLALKAGTAEDKILSQRIKNATISRFPGQDEFRMALLTGRADIAVDDADPNSLFQQTYEELMNIKPEPALAKQGVAYGFRKTVDLEEIQVFDIFLEQLIEKGAVEQMFAEYNERIIRESK
jgi:polar amino acid transport system substrate-binding protein